MHEGHALLVQAPVQRLQGLVLPLIHRGVLHAPVRAFELHQVPVVDDAVDRRTGEFSVSEDAAPLAELQVGGKDDAVVLIATL